MRDHQRVFAIQDTTYLDYTDHPSTQGLGSIRHTRSTKSQKSRYLWHSENFDETHPLAGEFTIEVPARQQQPKRQAALQATLSPPYRSQVPGQTENLPTVDVYLVWVVEPHPPDGIPPIEWLLLTNVKISTYPEARQRIHWYTHRWHVEVYFKVLKSDTKVEHTRLQTKDRLLRYIALMSVIAWRLYSMTLLNRDISTADCTHALTENEWKALYMITHKTHTLPTQTPTVAQVVGWIAKLGGFLGRKSDGTPGVPVLWRGWQRLTDISNTFALFQDTPENPTS